MQLPAPTPPKTRRAAVTQLPALSPALLPALLLALLLAACGGGGGDAGGSAAVPTVSSVSPASCSVADQKAWLRSYMADNYFWYRLSPSPDPAPHASTGAYFGALLYTGNSAGFPADRWSYTQTTESFDRLFADGQTLGYGLSVTGIESEAHADQPLRVRLVEPLSNAAARGVVRGDQIVSVNGRSAAAIVAAGDYSALTPANAGDTLALVLRGAAGDRSVVLTASVYTLTPVLTSAVVTSPRGRKLGYVVIDSMITQAVSPLDTAFAGFKAAGIADVVLDLRYNGGGLVSVGAAVASRAAATDPSRTYASLLFSDRHAADNQTFRFSSVATAAAVARVFVLTGPRTCSASEQVINALRGVGVQVVAIGGTSCGKPVGFVPVSACGTTYSAVNFESVNERNEGRYFDGFAPTCAVADDVTKPLASTAEPLLAAARGYADSGSCPATAAAAPAAVAPATLPTQRADLQRSGAEANGQSVR